MKSIGFIGIVVGIVAILLCEVSIGLFFSGIACILCGFLCLSVHRLHMRVNELVDISKQLARQISNMPQTDVAGELCERGLIQEDAATDEDIDRLLHS